MTEGTHKCLLHPDSPERAKYDALGWPVCLKHNLEADKVHEHMSKRHVREWAIIMRDLSRE